jgi:hypothetical protein
LRRTSPLFLVVLLGAASGGEFLGVVPGVQPRDVATQFTVVGQTERGVLIIADDARMPEFRADRGRYLDAEPRANSYYRVHPLAEDVAGSLGRYGTVLDYDGENYIVRVAPDALPGLLRLRAMVSRVNLKPIVITDARPFFPPVTRNPLIEAMVASVNPDSVLAFDRRLQEYRSRYSTSDSCRAAARWIADKFRAYGCDTVYLQQHTTGHAPNVIGIKYGTSGLRNPYAIIDGHFDSYQPNNAPGADDNASGTVAAIEACRVLRSYEFQSDMRFIAFSGEEFGLYGSDYYANDARNRGDSILGVFNFDMIAYVDVAPESLELVTKISNPPCAPFADFFTACADTYTTLLCQKDMVSDNQNSDHGPFWNNGYLAFCGIEDMWPVNPWYHTTGDTIGAGYNSNAFCTEVIKAGVSALATIGEPVPMNIPLVGYLHNRIDDVAGNGDGKWDAGESIGVYVTLKNFGTVGAHNVAATISTSDPYVTLYRTDATYGDIAGSDTAVSPTSYLMRAASNTPLEHIVSFDLEIASTESTWHGTFSLQVGEYQITDPVPDGPRTPAFYWAYDDVDAGYPPHPAYEWVEINTLGTRLSYTQNDQVLMVDLPSQFGPFKFYNQRYTQVSISADGWVCPGNYTTSNYQNVGLPNGATPPGVICLDWDDLYPVSGGGGHGNVYYYHDDANHRFVVEYDSVAYYAQQSVYDKFEAVIYDTTLAAPSGNSVIVAQYQTANGLSGATVGIEDPTRTIAIQDFYSGTLAHGAAPIVPGRAIKYVPIDPTGVVLEPRSGPEPGDLASQLVLLPNVVREEALVRFSLRQPGPVQLQIFDKTGKATGQGFELPRMAGGVHAWRWRAGDLPGGVYFVRLTTGNEVVTAKAVVFGR